MSNIHAFDIQMSLIMDFIVAISVTLGPGSQEK